MCPHTTTRVRILRLPARSCAATDALLLALVLGDTRTLLKVVKVFFQPNIPTLASNAFQANLRLNAQKAAASVMRHICNVNDPDLVARLLASLAEEPVDLPRNELVLQMLQARKGGGRGLITRGCPEVLDAGVSQASRKYFSLPL